MSRTSSRGARVPISAAAQVRPRLVAASQERLGLGAAAFPSVPQSRRTAP